MRLGLWVLWIALAALGPTTAWASSEDDYQRLRPQLSIRAGNPDYDAALGIAALDTNRTAEAIAAFERVLAVEPHNHPIRTELARAYQRVGDNAAAKREVDSLAHNPAVPAPVRANLSEYATVLDEAMSGGPITLSGYVHSTLGHDSNVNTATTSSYLLIPALSFLGPARLDDGLNAENDWFAEVENGLVLRVPYAAGRQFFLSSRLNRRQMQNSHLYNQMSTGGELGWQAETANNGWVSAGVNIQRVWLAENPYSDAMGVFGAWRIPTERLSALTLYGSAGHSRYLGQPDRNAKRMVLGATHQRVLRPTGWTPTLLLGGYAGIDETDNGKADFWSHRLAGATVGLEAFPRESTALFAEAGYELRDYRDDYPLFLKPRFDRQVDVAAGISQQLPWKLTLRPRVAWRNTESNIGLYDYARWVGEVQVRRVF